MGIRAARAGDIARIVDLAEMKRAQYETYQPVFWRRAANSREAHASFLSRALQQENVIALVHEDESDHVDGFVIAVVVPTPPVYNPGGPTCSIDDFWVERPEDWPTVGRALLDTASAQARERGAAQTVVVCGHRDEAKRAMLAAAGYTIASEWYVRPHQMH